VVTPLEPTEEMLAQAQIHGLVDWEGQAFPRLQIIELSALLDGARPLLPQPVREG
jgi:hypothetical protein